MSNLIVNLRGTSGSGKSTVARTLIERYKATPINLDLKGRAGDYRLVLPGGQKLVIFGRYDTACGGCDGFKNYDVVFERLQQYAGKYHVLFEGLLISTNYGRLGEFTQQYDPNFVFAFLDTPLEVCLERVKTRRAAKGNLEPLNPKQTSDKWKASNTVRDKCEQLGRRYQIIRHEHAVKDVLNLFGVKVRS